MSLLIKSFQIATDVSTSSESTIKILEKSQLSLGLISSELKQALTRSSMTWINASSDLHFEKFDKSLNFFIDTTNKDIRFFKPSQNETKIYAIQYKHDSSQGLLRYEKELNSALTGDWNQRFNDFGTKLSDTDNLIAYVGLEDPNDSTSSPKSPPDLSADSSITADIIIPEDEIAAITLSYTLDRYNYDSNDTGDDDDTTLKKGEKPNYITIKLTLKDSDKAGSYRNFSREISLNGN